MAIPLYATGSLSPTFVPAPPVGVAVKLPSAFALFKWFPTILREPLSASDTLSEATAPVKLPAWHCPTAGSQRLVRNPILQGWYPNSGSMADGEFDWGGRLRKGIGGAQRFPQNGRKPFEAVSYTHLRG